MGSKQWWRSRLVSFNVHYRRANVSDSAVVIAYYTLLSLFPLFIIIGSGLKVINVGYSHLTDTLSIILPVRIYRLLKPIIYSALKDGGKEQLSIGLLIALWTSSRMIAAFQRTVNRAYGIMKSNLFRNRLWSLLWNFIFITIIMIFLLVIGFGRLLLRDIARNVTSLGSVLETVGKFQLPLTLLGLFAVMNLMYYFVPFVHVKWRFIWLGSLVVTLGLMIISKAFSLYLDYFAKNLSAYRTLGTFILLMIWLYLFGMILLIGAVINASLQSPQVKIKDH